MMLYKLEIMGSNDTVIIVPIIEVIIGHNDVIMVLHNM